MNRRRNLCTLLVACTLIFLAWTPARAGEFASAVSYTAGSEPHGVAIGDFNGDGIPDLAVANYDSNNVSVLLGNGNGTFQAAVDYPIPDCQSGQLPGPYSVAVGDFTGSGVLDLAVANSNMLAGNGCVSVLLGNGDGTFQSAVNYASVGAPVYVCVADLTNNGILDLVVANHGGGVTVFLGNGNGTFQPYMYTFSGGVNPMSVAVGSFNGSLYPSVAVANKNSNNVCILIGVGNGTFQPYVCYPVGVEPAVIAVGDFTNNGILDLAVTNYSDNTLSVLLGNGDGTFQTQTTCTTGDSPSGLVAVDVNGDGNLDLVNTNMGLLASDVGVYLGNGSGTSCQAIFQTAVTYASGADPRIVAAGDLNNDGAPDLAVADARAGAGVDVLLNLGGTYLTTTSSANPSDVGQAVTFTTTVTACCAPNPNGTPTGTVTFENGTTVLGTSTLSTSGVATFTTSSLPAGTYTINALYSGETGVFNPNTAPPFTQTVQTVPVVSLSPTSCKFGTFLLGTTSKACTVTLSNTGSATLSITSITITGTDPADFSQTNTCGSSVLAGANCTISVTFTPTAINSRTGTLSVSDNAAGSPQTVSLTGTGTEVQLVPGALNFGSVKVGTTSSAKNVTLTNIGSTSLSITSITITGTNATDFAQTNTCPMSPATLAAGANCTISVTFTPGATGAASGSLNVKDNGGGMQQTVGLGGTGT